MTGDAEHPSDQQATGSSILVVDDDRVLREQLLRAFTKRGFQASGAGSYDEAIAIAMEETPELAVVDLRIPGRSGLEVVRRLAELDSTTKIVVLTGYGSIATALEAMRLGATNFLPKPADAQDILAAFDPESDSASTGQDELTAPSLARAEWEHINRVLADCDGNVSHAARRLGLHRRSLQRKLQKRPPRS